MSEQMEFVTINLSKKQVDMEHPYHNDKNNKDYLRILAPGNGILFYPAESIKVNSRDESKVYFTRPKGTELQINYSKRRENVPDDAPAKEKYDTYQKTVKIEDLKEMYEEERKIYLEKNSAFVNYEVPTEWGLPFTGKDNREYISITIPIKENEDRNYYAFVVSAESFKESSKSEGMSYFGYPKKKKEEEADYMITLKRSVKQPDGSYQDVLKEVSSTELAEHIEAAKKTYSFVNIEISKKLVREFNSKEGKTLLSVSVPVYDAEQKKDLFYQIVVNPERVKDTEKEGIVRLSMFRKGSDGMDYAFKAEASILNETTQQYEKKMKEMTAVEIARCFKESRERYKEQNPVQERSLGDELRNNSEPQQGGQATPGFRNNVRRGGR